MPSRTINLRLPEALYKQVEDLSKATVRTKSLLTIDALTRYVQREYWQILDIRQGLDEADAGEFASSKEVDAVFAKYWACSEQTRASSLKKHRLMPAHIVY